MLLAVPILDINQFYTDIVKDNKIMISYLSFSKVDINSKTLERWRKQSSFYTNLAEN